MQPFSERRSVSASSKVNSQKVITRRSPIQKSSATHKSSSSPDDVEVLFEKLVQMIPTLPKDRKLGKLEILQAVIDYIQELEARLAAHPEHAENLCGGLTRLRLSLASSQARLVPAHHETAQWQFQSNFHEEKIEIFFFAFFFFINWRGNGRQPVDWTQRVSALKIKQHTTFRGRTRADVFFFSFFRCDIFALSTVPRDLAGRLNWTNHVSLQYFGLSHNTTVPRATLRSLVQNFGHSCNSSVSRGIFWSLVQNFGFSYKISVSRTKFRSLVQFFGPSWNFSVPRGKFRSLVEKSWSYVSVLWFPFQCSFRFMDFFDLLVFLADFLLYAKYSVWYCIWKKNRIKHFFKVSMMFFSENFFVFFCEFLSFFLIWKTSSHNCDNYALNTWPAPELLTTPSFLLPNFISRRMKIRLFERRVFCVLQRGPSVHQPEAANAVAVRPGTLHETSIKYFLPRLWSRSRPLFHSTWKWIVDSR